MKLYICIGWDNLKYGKELARYFEAEGFDITSHYLAPDYEADQDSAEAAMLDLKELIAADALLHVTGDGIARSTTGGRHHEFGIGMGLGKVLVVLGNAENIFQQLPGVLHAQTPEQAATTLITAHTFKLPGSTLPITNFLKEVGDVVEIACLNHGPTVSAHEGLAVIMEEFEELKAHVWKKRGYRHIPSMYRECVDLAAAAARFAIDLCINQKDPR